MQNARVLILTGKAKGDEGICFGQELNGNWAFSANSSAEIFSLRSGEEFGLLVNLSLGPSRN